MSRAALRNDISSLRGRTSYKNTKIQPLVSSLNPFLTEEVAIVRERVGNGIETRRGEETSERKRRELERGASTRARETEKPSRGRGIDRPAENYPLAGDFAVCERPITYESSQWGALSRCSWAHADTSWSLTHVGARIRSRSFIVRPDPTSSTSPSTSACVRVCIWGGVHPIRSEVRHVLCICIAKPTVNQCYRVAFCGVIASAGRSSRSRREDCGRACNSVSCAVWRIRVFRSDVSSRSRTMDGTRRGCCWI